MYDVFISYSSKDQKTADAVVNYLESSKIKCWIAYRDAEAGEYYAASIMRAIKNSSIFLLVFSENSNKSKHVLKEIDAACKYERIIIPFKIDESQLDEAVEYYLSATHWLDAITAPMDNHLKELVVLVNRYLCKPDITRQNTTADLPANNTSTETNLKLVTGRDITKKDLEQTAYLEQSMFAEYDCGQYTFEQFERWHKLNPNMFFLLKDTMIDKIIGYILIVPITKECYEKRLNGNLLDVDIDDNSILSYDYPGLYYLNIAGKAISEVYRDSYALLQLMNAFIDKIAELSKYEIYVKSLIMEAISREGQRICKMFGMKPQMNTARNTTIYDVSFLPPEFNVNSKTLASLHEIYKNVNAADMAAY